MNRLLLLLTTMLPCYLVQAAGTGAATHADTAILPRETMAGMRKTAVAALPEGVYIMDQGRQGIFTADVTDQQTADDSAMTVIAGGRRYKRVTANGTVDARWFGAIPGDNKDDWAAIQKAVDFCTLHGDQYSTVHLGPGLYLLSRPVMLYNWSGTAYGYHSTNLEGESSFWESAGNGTTLQCLFKDKFAIGIELGKGNRISRLSIVGGFKPPYPDRHTFYRMSFEEFSDPTCRDSNYSPYAAIVIDPFGISTSQLPPDGGYPGYASWYRGQGGNSGSSGISIEDVYINGFVVGICSSPNSYTRNAELTYIHKIQFTNTKLCISGSQDQEKGNIVSNLGCWGITHTVFGTGLYGAHTPGNWYVENVNVAGAVNRLVYNAQGGYFGSHFRNIFTESLGRFGTIISNQGTVVEASEFGFAYYGPDDGEYLTPQVESSGVTFIGCNFRMYGTFKPVTLAGSSTYFGCSFESVPYANYTTGPCPYFTNCVVRGYQSPLLGIAGVRNMERNRVWQACAYGNYSISNGIAVLKIDNARPASPYPLNLFPKDVSLNVSTDKDGIRSAVVPLAADETIRVKEGDVICTSPVDAHQGILGIVTAVTPTGFTISYVPSWVSAGQSYDICIYLPYLNMTFLGDMTAGSNLITNVQGDFADFDDFIILSGLMRCNKFINTNCDQSWRASQFRIVGYNAATRTATLDQRATRTASGVYFSNTDAVKDLHVEDYDQGFGYLDSREPGEILQAGGHIFTRDSTGRTVRYLVTKSGFYNAAYSHDKRQAEWVEERP